MLVTDTKTIVLLTMKTKTRFFSITNSSIHTVVNYTIISSSNSEVKISRRSQAKHVNTAFLLYQLLNL